MVSRGDVDEFSVVQIPTGKVTRWWDLIRGGIETIIAKNRITFRPEDVYVTLAKNAATLCLTLDSRGMYAGFTILTQERNPFTQENYLMVWFAYSKVRGASEGTMPHLEKIGRELGYSLLIMHSPRKGWERTAVKLGFSLREVVWQKRL